MTDRRGFLKLAGMASLGASWPAVVKDVSAADAQAAGFGFADDRVPMNAANLCPMPSVVSDAVSRYAGELDRDMSHVSRRRIESLKEDARRRLAAQLGVTADEIAIVRNTSEGNNIVVQGMPLESGDEVLLWDQNHPSNGVAWDLQAARSGCVPRRLSLPASARSVDEIVATFVAATSPRTRVVSFTHISNVTGTRLPAAEICGALREKRRDIHIHVDGAQTWGIADVDLRRLGCDSFSASAHKWFMGPRETGLLYIREPHIERLWPNCVSVPWGRGVDPEVAGARKFEAFGQRDDAAIAALGDAAGFHERLGPAAIERRARQLADRLRDGIADLGIELVSPRDAAVASNVIIVAAPADNGGALVEHMLNSSGVVAAAVGGLRLSPHVYNTEAHIDRAVAGIGRARGLLGG